MTSGPMSLSETSQPSRSGKTVPAGLVGAVIGIGSLPSLSADEAIRTVATFCPEVPFWPQLPQLSEGEGVIRQALGVLEGLIEPRTGGYGYQVKPGRIDSVVDALHNSSGCLTSANAAGFPAFEAALKQESFRYARALKGQIEGPVTLATYLFYRDRAFLADAALFAAIAFHIAQIVCWQIDRLGVFGLPVLMFLDEPALCLDDVVPLGISQERRLNALSAIFHDIRSRGAFSGLHCCAERPFDRMCAAQPDILSFDAHHGLEQFFSDKHGLNFVHSGGWVAYGMIPTTTDLTSVQPASIFARWLTCASMAGDPQSLAQRAIVTATCGLGLLDASSVIESFHLTRGLGRLIKQLAGVETAT
jgi:hypothetical protein